MYSCDHRDMQNPINCYGGIDHNCGAKYNYDADFVAQFCSQRIDNQTGDDVFHGCATSHTDLAIAYGNVRTYKLLCRLHHDEKCPYVDLQHSLISQPVLQRLETLTELWQKGSSYGTMALTSP